MPNAVFGCHPVLSLARRRLLSACSRRCRCRRSSPSSSLLSSLSSTSLSPIAPSPSSSTSLPIAPLSSMSFSSSPVAIVVIVVVIVSHHDAAYCAVAVACRRHRCCCCWRQRWASAGRDGDAITMRVIEIAVDGGGGDGQWRRNGRQDGRAATAGQGDGVSPSYS